METGVGGAPDRTPFQSTCRVSPGNSHLCPCRCHLQHVSLPSRDSGIFLFPFSGWDSLDFDFVLFLSGIRAPPFLALCCPQFSVLKSQEALVSILPVRPWPTCLVGAHSAASLAFLKGIDGEPVLLISSLTVSIYCFCLLLAFL